ncbi:MAG TPA: nucleotidyltransferase family protein [Thermaerobacter sp.]
MVGAVVLAAGLSTRLGRAKQLLPLGDRTVLETTLAAVLASRVSPVVVVVSPAVAAAGQPRLRDDRVTVVVNPHPERGQSSSLRVGLQALLKRAPEIRASVTVLGDQPLIPPALIDRLIARFQEQVPPPLAVRPVSGGQPGMPVLVSRELFPEIMAVQGDTGARPVLQRHRDAVVTVEVDCPAIHQDLDTWADYLAICRALGVAPAAGPDEPAGGQVQPRPERPEQRNTGSEEQPE